jgi:TrmH family RNA methyltransferase
MLTKNQAKFISGLKLKKNREEHGLFIAEGAKIVSDILHSGIKVKQIFSSKNFQLDIFNYQIEVIRIKESELKRISALQTPNEVLAVCEMPKHQFKADDLKGKLSLVLDTIQDPGNLGTIIRVADWFGIEHIICSLDTVEVYNPKVIQATMGSISRVKVHYTELSKFLAAMNEGQKSEVRGQKHVVRKAEHSKGKKEVVPIKVYGALLDGESIYSKELAKEGLIVMGNESKGISENILPFITDKILIPNYGKGAESLNVAIATAVIAAEFKRKK